MANSELNRPPENYVARRGRMSGTAAQAAAKANGAQPAVRSAGAQTAASAAAKANGAQPAARSTAAQHAAPAVAQKPTSNSAASKKQESTAKTASANPRGATIAVKETAPTRSAPERRKSPGQNKARPAAHERGKPVLKRGGRNKALNSSMRHGIRLRRWRTLKQVLLWCAVLALAVGLGAFIRANIVTLTEIDGDSMSPALRPGEMAVVNKWCYNDATPEYGDIVLCSLPNRDGVFARYVLAKPGDSLLIENGAVYVNGSPVTSAYAAAIAREPYGPVKLNEGRYFVSTLAHEYGADSRDADVGAITADSILGRITRVVWPFADARRLQ